MTIATLIEEPDLFEVIRDEIAAILKVESAAQQALATAAGKDPRLWDLRVFVERSNPWADFVEGPEQLDAPPIVNVSVDNLSFDGAASDTVERQKSTTTYHLDCYGYGVSADDGAGGHLPGDREAALACQRAVRLVRNILMAGEYTYLGLRKTVWRRWIRTIEFFKPPSDAEQAQKIVGGRISLEVQHNEFSPQVVPETLELISTTVRRAETGEILLGADYDFGAP